MKKITGRILALILTITLTLTGIAAAESREYRIVTTIYPIFDWVCEILGDREDVNVTLLLDNGVDLHSYQPTARDLMNIVSADLFIYVGGESDEWVRDLPAETANPDLRAVCLMDVLGSAVKEEEFIEGMEGEAEETGEEAESDEHVWLSLRNAQVLVLAIADRLSGIDPEHADAYRTNASAYIEKLADLDARYMEMVANAEYHTVLFGDRFPFRYLMDDYGLSYYAAFSGCSAETEAAFETIVFLARTVDRLDLPAVLTIEGGNDRIARTVVGATASGDQKILTLDSLQGKPSADAGYLSVMENNLTVLREALNK